MEGFTFPTSCVLLRYMSVPASSVTWCDATLVVTTDMNGPKCWLINLGLGRPLVIN